MFLREALVFTELTNAQKVKIRAEQERRNNPPPYPSTSTRIIVAGEDGIPLGATLGSRRNVTQDEEWMYELSIGDTVRVYSEVRSC